MKGRMLIALTAAVLLLGWLLHPGLDRTPAVAGAGQPRVSGPQAAAPSLSARSFRSSSQPLESAAEAAPPTNIISSLLKGEAPQLSAAQIESYLQANRRGVESLLAAFRVSGEKQYLSEAQAKFPNDPRVAFASLFKSDSPEERRQWLDQFKVAAANNSMPNYLSALDYFKAGQRERAVQEVLAASDKPNFQDYSMDFLQSAEEAYLSAGYPEGQAKAIASTQLLLPHLAELKQVGVDLGEMAKSSRQAGDEASAQAALQMVLQLGQHLEQPSGWNTVIGGLVGAAVERIALNNMDPAGEFGPSGQTVQGRLDELAQQRATAKAYAQQFDGLLEAMSDHEMALFFDREKLFGETAALQWAMNKSGRK